MVNRFEIVGMIADKKSKISETNIEIDVCISQLFKKITHKLNPSQMEDLMNNEIQKLRDLVVVRDRLEKELEILKDNYNKLIENIENKED